MPPTQQEVEETLRNIDDYITTVGDEIAGQINDSTDSGEPVQGRQVQHGTLDYSVILSTGFSHLKIHAAFDAAQSLATDHAIANADGPQVQIDQASVQSARRELREQADEDLGEIRESLVRRLGDSPMAVQLLQEQDGFVYGFSVERQLHIYEDGLSLREFSDEVQSVVNYLWLGKEFLINAYNIRDGGGDGGDIARGFA